MMRYFRNAAWFAIGLFISFVWLLPSAFAQTNTYSTAGAIANIVNGTPGTFTTNAISSGVVATSNGTVLVNASGLKIPVPSSVAAQASKGAIAAAAGKIAVKAIPGVSTAIALAELCTLLCPSNDYKIAPDGASIQQIEKPGIAGDAPGTGYVVSVRPVTVSKTPYLACLKQGQAYQVSYPTSTLQNVVAPALSCTFEYKHPNGSTGTFGPFQIARQANYYVPEYILATEVQTQADVLQRAEQQARFKHLYDAIKSNQAADPTAWPEVYNPIKPTTPVTVTAPPVTSPERVVSETTKTQPDGSIDTTTTKEKTVVSPTTTGTTVADSKTTFPTQTVTTSTTVNNVTNTTVTETHTVNHPAPIETTPTTPTEFPDDYNKEVTQAKIAAELAGDGAPALPNLTERVDTEIEKNKTDLETLINEMPDKIATDKDNWFSWVWTPPLAQCSPSTGSVRGVAISLDICPTVSMIREALGFLFALFGAWTIYGEIFKRPV